MSTILVVDDEKKIRNTYKQLFEREGHTVLDCDNIVDARKFIKAVPVHLMLLDINMGEYGGDILYEISHAFHRKLRIIVSSVYPIDEQKHIMPDAYDFFDKSEGNKVLLQKVKGALEEKESEKKHILVVDDDIRERRILHHLLTKFGYHAVEFGDNLKMLKYLENADTRVDLIVLDLAMPRIPGVDFFEMIKEKYPAVKIMIASNYSIEDQKTYVFDADAYCDKSDGKKELLDKIEGLFRKESENEKK